MADQIDVAAEASEMLLSATIASRPRYEGVSAHECIKCGDKIPHGRRVALPGVKLCVECAE